MKKLPIIQILVIFSLFSVLGQVSEAGPPVYENLFKGDNFNKWTQVNGDPVSDGWSIKNGVVWKHTKGARSIITKKHYRNFELVFEWKISEGGNSGVKYLSKENLGLEYQLLDDDNHRDGKNLTHRAGSIYELVAAPDDKPIKPVGQWNSAKIVVNGNNVEHWLNGTKVAELELGSKDWKKRFQESKYVEHEGFGTWTGPIYLQDHGDVVWFRNVRIRKL